MSGDVWKVIAAILGVLTAVLAIFTFVTGKASLPEIFGDKPAAVTSVQTPSAAGAAPAAAPCVQLAQMGFRCSAESLLEALATDDPETFRLFVAGGITGDSIAHSDWDGDRTVLSRAKERNLPGVGSLLSAMSTKGGDACKLLNEAVTTRLADASACSVFKKNTCRSQMENDLRKAAAEEDRILGGDYEGLANAERCPQAIQDIDMSTYYRNYQGRLELPRCSLNQSAFYSNCAQRQIMSGNIDGAACDHAFQSAKTSCRKKECESFAPDLRKTYPTRAAFVEEFGPTSAKLARFRNLEKACR